MRHLATGLALAILGAGCAGSESVRGDAASHDAPSAAGQGGTTATGGGAGGLAGTTGVAGGGGNGGAAGMTGAAGSDVSGVAGGAGAAGSSGAGGAAGQGGGAGRGGTTGAAGGAGRGGTTGAAGAAGAVGRGGAAGNMGIAGAAGRGGTGGTTARGLHVSGKFLYDGDGNQVILRGPELVYRWGEYMGLTSLGVDVPWEGGRNNAVGATTIAEMAKTKANAVRILGGLPSELDALLNAAIVQQKMFVAVARVDWTNAQTIATLKKYGNYVILHPRGEFTHRDANLWRTEALRVVREIRALGYTSPIEIGTTGYGQTWSTIATHGKEVADSDPLKNTLYLLQLYSELAGNVNGTVDSAAAFTSPVIVDACLFLGGITAGYGNDANTYKRVWDESFRRNMSSFYWDWWGDGEGNSMTTNGTFTGLNAIGQYIVNDSPAALKNTTKTPYLLNASVQ